MEEIKADLLPVSARQLHTCHKKNCGGRPPVEDEENGGATICPMTELCGQCRKTWGLYNGRSAEDGTEKEVEEVKVVVEGIEGMASMIGNGRGGGSISSNNGDYLRPLPVKLPTTMIHVKIVKASS